MGESDHLTGSKKSKTVPLEDESRRGWKQDPDGVQGNILKIAAEVFAEAGLSGARVDEIARRTATSKRMIYYYFGDKEGLFRAVLEDAYARMRLAEDALDLAEVAPVEALRQLAEFTFDHHRSNTSFIRLVMIENVHGAQHMSQSPEMSLQNSSAIRHLNDIYRRGCQQGLFRRGLSALELHWHISALCYFNVSNRATFSNIFGTDIFTDRGQQMLRRHVGDMILRFVMRDGIGVEEGQSHTQKDTRMINPDIFRFLEVWDAKWSGMGSAATGADRRLRFESIAREMRLPMPEGVETDEEHWIESEGGPVRVRIFRHDKGGVQPALIYMHGGGWMQGSPETHWDITARIAGWGEMTVISVDYALAPESPYPKAFQQCCGVLKWARDKADEIGIDATRIAVGGDSAGGNLGAALAIWAKDNDIPVAAQLLIYPACDFDRTRPSYSENAEGPLLKVAGMAQTNAWYCPEEERLSTDPYVAPLVAKSHAGLPPAFIGIAQNDPLRDSGGAYAKALTDAGVQVELDTGEGLIHGYMRSMEYCDVAETKLRVMTEWLAKKLA